MESQHDPYLLKQAKARVGFRMHLRSYLIVNAGLWVLWALIAFIVKQSTDYVPIPWPLFSMIGWGIGLASHYFSVYRAGDQKNMIEREYQKLANQQR